MKSTDKFLIAIVAGALLLVVIAFVVVLVQPKPAYKPDNTPEGVAFNYLLALQQEDYERAYVYLSPTLPGYPLGTASFQRQILENARFFSNDQLRTTLEIQSAKPTDASGEHVQVIVRETHFLNTGTVFTGQWLDSFAIQLAQEKGAWKIVNADRYFAYCWISARGC